MDVSPYLMRRLRTLDEFLETKGGNASLLRREIDEAYRRTSAPSGGPGRSGGTSERVRLTLVSSNGGRDRSGRSGSV